MHTAKVPFKNAVWLCCQVLLLTALVIAVVNLEVPLVKSGIHEGVTMYRHYSRKHDAQTWPKANAAMAKDIVLLDSLLLQMENRRKQTGGALVDELYTYAADAGFHTRKVEAGIPQRVGRYYETGLSIDGTGSYTAAGVFVEKIENSGQSTRIRQFTISRSDTGECEIFIDVAVREEGAEVVR